MLQHIEQKKLPFTPQQMFDLVAAVDKYSDFVPWCAASRINRWEEGNGIFYADLIVGYKIFREKFSSKVHLEPPSENRAGRIYIEYVSGPFQSLQNEWQFKPSDDGGCIIDFSVEFSFQNKMLQGLVDTFFEQVVKRMVSAFEKRAEIIYAASPSNPG